MVDAAGNLIVKKPASAGREQAPGVVLQAHLDMVCQKNAGTAHDFRHDAIVPRLARTWSRVSPPREESVASGVRNSAPGEGEDAETLVRSADKRSR